MEFDLHTFALRLQAVKHNALVPEAIRSQASVLGSAVKGLIAEELERDRGLVYDIGVAVDALEEAAAWSLGEMSKSAVIVAYEAISAARRAADEAEAA